MECLNKVKEILQKYDLKNTLPEGIDTPYGSDTREERHPDLYTEKTDGWFIKKYKDYIPHGHYGFALGVPTPRVWVDALDEILELLTQCDGAFEIAQIKTKYGGIRFYVYSKVIADIDEIENLIEDFLYDERFIY
jgi:hypothetical protein